MMGNGEETNRTSIPVTSANDTPAQEQVLTPEEQALAAAQAKEEAINADIDAGKEAYEISFAHQLPPEDAIRLSVRRHYDKGRGSIQDLARIYHIEVSKVLALLDMSDLGEVEVIGDLIDKQEAGPEATISNGMKYTVPFTTD